MSPRQWQCSVCSTQFTRSEHLRRHLRSHENKRPYECSLCRRPFTRRDAKIRHERTCKEKPAHDGSCLQANAIEEPGSADFVQPYEYEFGIPPSHEIDDELLMGMSMSMDMPYPSDFAALDWLYSTRMSSDSIITAERLDFLAHFTSENGMGTFLARETLEERQKLVLQYELDSVGHSQPRASMSETAQTIRPEMLEANAAATHPLTPRTFEIIHHFHSITTRKTDRSVVKLDWTADVEALCRSFFSPGNITRFLGYFWSLWYPNCPFIHRASFDPQTAPPALLCVMLMIGACLSPHTDDATTARMWLDCLEEWAFSDSSFREETSRDTSLSLSLDMYIDRQKRRLECIQTAYLVCSLQKREGSVEAHARVRRYRHATMVMLARDVGLSTASHRNLKMDAPSEGWWRQFAVEEGLIRTMTYVFLFDAALTIFHNCPPRMVVSELKTEMACPEACFQAESAEECFAALNDWRATVFWRKHLSIVAVVKKICQKDLTGSAADEYSQVGTLNLFTVVQSLHSLTFHLENSIIFESTLLPVKTGLENWRRIWNKRQPEDSLVPDTPEALWKKVGFISYSPEFWHLARIIVDKIGDDNADDEDGGGALTAVPERGRERKRYDHTDMTDVNGLIMEYRRMSLGAAL
ncbi:hypothetical protein BJY04DRAFT_231649 [Aspergillus karnatakaensis]|uniref:transcription factor domain-containing protein n=1 Tax=Aspergillus karnatakaensis TaxID=1810916 RepID=UPI003CCE45BC